MVFGLAAWFSDVLSLVRLEAGHFVRFRQQRIAAIAVCFLPAIYVAIYVGSVWDPAAHSQALPVAVVNLDQGLQYQGQDFNAGRDIENQLHQRKTFGFVEGLGADEAREAVRLGRLAFALVIPPDFSAQALPGAAEGAGQLDLFLSEGNNYQSAQIARRFAEELGHSVNDHINRNRWSMVLLTARDSKQNLHRLHEGVHELSQGARVLLAGTQKAEAGARDLARGSRLLDDGLRQASGSLRPLIATLRQLDDLRAHEGGLQQLYSAMDSIERGHRDLGAGLAALGQGTEALSDGIHQFRLQAQDNWLFPATVADSLAAADEGSTQVASGMKLAISAQHDLQDGSSQVFTHVRAMARSLDAMGQGLNAPGTALPDDQAMDRLNSGTVQLAAGASELSAGQTHLREGSARLSAGLAALEHALDVSLPTIEGTAEGLADSVTPTLNNLAPVPTAGASIAPNVVSAAIWLGAGIIVFLVNVKVLPTQASHFSPTAQLAGKIAFPAFIIVVQTLVVMLVLLLALSRPVGHLIALAAVLIAAAMCFLFIVFVLARAMGDAGKALAMLFLAVQLSSSGGILPVELSGQLYASISPWLPMTWVVRGIKACMFDAYAGNWWTPLAVVVSMATVLALVACYAGRWRYVRFQDMRPSIDF